MHLQRNPPRLNGARRMVGSAMAVLSVGPGQQYSTIAVAVAAAQNGDTIQVQAGTYPDQYVSIQKNITLRGVGGMVEIVSTRPDSERQGHLHHEWRHHDREFHVFRSSGS